MFAHVSAGQRFALQAEATAERGQVFPDVLILAITDCDGYLHLSCLIASVRMRLLVAVR
jgi:hypothetical protein